MIRLAVVLIPLLLLLSSCSKTRREIAFEPEMRAKLDAYLAEMAEIAAACPTEPMEFEGSALDPLPSFGAAETPTNTLVASVEQLGEMDNVYGFKMETYLELYNGRGVAGFFSDSYLSEEAPEGYQEEMNAHLDVRYVVAIRTERYSPPEIIDEKTFQGGQAQILAALYDRNDKSWKCAYRLSADPPSNVEFKTKDYQKTENAKFYVNESVRGDLMDGLQDALEKATGGTFILK